RRLLSDQCSLLDGKRELERDPRIRVYSSAEEPRVKALDRLQVIAKKALQASGQEMPLSAPAHRILQRSRRFARYARGLAANNDCAGRGDSVQDARWPTDSRQLQASRM